MSEPQGINPGSDGTIPGEVDANQTNQLGQPKLVGASSSDAQASKFKLLSQTLGDSEVPPEKPQKLYYEEYVILCLNNLVLHEKLISLKTENKELAEKLKNLEVVSCDAEKWALCCWQGC